MKSIFTDKTEVPNNVMLKTALGETFESWQTLHALAKSYCPVATEEWKFGGEKYGWSFRVSDSKRVLIYLLPREGFFKVAFVFGQKAMDKVLASTISDTIKNELIAAKPYAEGRGIRLAVTDTSNIDDIAQLLAIKVSK